MSPEEWRRLPTAEKNKLRAAKHARRRAEREALQAGMALQDVIPKPNLPTPDWRHLPGGPFFSRSLRPLDLSDLYRGAHCFVLLSGPSAMKVNLSLLNHRGVMTCGVNNSPAIHRPTMWTYVDPAFKFHDAIWRDPGVMKFVPVQHLHTCPLKQKVSDGSTDWIKRDGEHVYPSSFPSVIGYKRNSNMDVSRFLSEDTITYGLDKKHAVRQGKERLINVFVCVLKLLYAVGIRDVYLLGCDFKMDSDKPYAFDQSKSPNGARGCNRVFVKMNLLCQELQPRFLESGYRIWNCTEGSGLTVFPYLSYHSALTQATRDVPQDPLDTANWYLSQ